MTSERSKHRDFLALTFIIVHYLYLKTVHCHPKALFLIILYIILGEIQCSIYKIIFIIRVENISEISNSISG